MAYCVNFHPHGPYIPMCFVYPVYLVITRTSAMREAPSPLLGMS